MYPHLHSFSCKSSLSSPHAGPPFLPPHVLQTLPVLPSLLQSHPATLPPSLLPPPSLSHPSPALFLSTAPPNPRHQVPPSPPPRIPKLVPALPRPPLKPLPCPTGSPPLPPQPQFPPRSSTQLAWKSQRTPSSLTHESPNSGSSLPRSRPPPACRSGLGKIGSETSAPKLSEILRSGAQKSRS